MVELGVRPTVRSELIQGQAMLALLRGQDAEAWRLYDVALGIEYKNCIISYALYEQAKQFGLFG